MTGTMTAKDVVSPRQVVRDRFLPRIVDVFDAA